MNNNKGSSQGVTQKGNICKKEAKVTDQFYNMITPALEETKRVLNIRAKNLEAWTPADQKNFEDIFGLPGDAIITMEHYAPCQKSDNNGNFTPQTKNIDAHTFIKEGVYRMIMICDNLIIETRTQDNVQLIYGNFKNYTNLVNGSARIPAAQTTHIDLNRPQYQSSEYKNKSKAELLKLEYRERISIDILQNFTCKNPTGENSRVSTLCHELSHLFIIWDGEQYYGGLSSNDLGKKREIANAKELKSKHDPLVFNNAYNIEKYFEIS
ncbi:hypothetical protein P4513_004494 [Escherichia coli]|nr:hypothetical protein [Escherichia coli]EKY6714415.1 hypothetical protein [Escherichia coli]HBH5321349.1 hypothetical protein [Escherichia coli]HDB9913706.1 hypothetical protein [Escherichia coli]